MSKAIFVIGATGRQGGATVRALIDHAAFDQSKYTIHAMTRDPSSASAKRIQEQSATIKLVKGDLNDAASAFKNLTVEPWGVFIVTAVQKKPKTEDEVGKSFVDEAKKAGAKHIVLSTVDRGEANGGFNRTNVPHFMTKHDIEAHLMDVTKGTDISYTILRPVFFLDNLEWGFTGKLINTTWRDHLKGKMQLIDSADIGKIAANAFIESSSESYYNKAISLAGDELTFEEANKIFKAKTGQNIPVTFGLISTIVTKVAPELALMFDFFNDPGYHADIAYVNKLAPISNFSQWVDKSSFVKQKQ